MAGDWIKMRSNLWDDPRVTRICDLTDQGEAMVIGALYWLWAAADQHTENGKMPGLSLRGIDRKTGVAGFGKALQTVDWIDVEDDGITICRFDEHNGASAKRRSMEAKRKATVRKASANDADNMQTESGDHAELEKEKEKELKNNRSSATAPDRFADFWETYPKKVKKTEARKKWKSKRLDAKADAIIADVHNRLANDRRWLDGFVPDPTTYINGERWEDEIERGKRDDSEPRRLRALN